MKLKLLTATFEAKLRDNARRQAPLKGTKNEIDFIPVVKLFTPDGQCTWLLTELDEDGDTLFGLCDLGLGCPELGYVSLSELRGVRGNLGLTVERDKWFRGGHPLSVYAQMAKIKRAIAA